MSDRKPPSETREGEWRQIGEIVKRITEAAGKRLPK